VSVLIAQIGFHAVGSVPIAHGIGMPVVVILVAAYAMLCILGMLLGIWAAIRDKPTPWRFVGVVAAIVAITCLQKLPGFEFVSGIERFASPLLFTMVVPTSLALFIGRMAGVRLERVSRNASSNLAFQMVRLEEGLEGTDGASAEPPKLQFSLWSLLSWTTAFAVLLSSLRVWHVVTSASVVDWLVFAISIAAFFPVMLVALWIALADRWLGARIIVFVLVVSASALFAASASIMAFVLIGALLVFRRLTGYCLVWRKPAVWSLFRGIRR
jgi:hypothetical protein